MSRSFKKQPFQAICGGDSAKRDKVLAHRGVRRTHRAQLHQALQDQEFDVLLKHRHECHWNNTYSWGRDGSQLWNGLTNDHYADFIKANFDPQSWLYADDRYMCWPPQWYVEMMRK